GIEDRVVLAVAARVGQHAADGQHDLLAQLLALVARGLAGCRVEDAAVAAHAVFPLAPERRCWAAARQAATTAGAWPREGRSTSSSARRLRALPSSTRPCTARSCSSTPLRRLKSFLGGFSRRSSRN